ncbi:MAG: serine/threonine-protein kinase [Polyangiaceae bacterium]
MSEDQRPAGSKPRAKDRYIGREILGGQFKITKKIGTGGMGSVYKASQPEMNRMVAVKILHAKLKNRKDLVSRFRREARAMSHLTHPNTVKVMMYGELETGELYIVMEYLEGKNLNQIVRREGPLTVERAIPVLLQVCGALEEAHELGMVHRDLKPENIFLTTSGGMTDFAKVLDFGLAKVTERELRPGSIMLTQEGMVFGTPEFMSPEQAQGLTLDRRSDIYSLAIILYEALTGKLPFDARSSMEYIQLHVTKPPIPLDERLPGKTFPPGLGDVIAKALAKSPDDRYATATEFAEAMRPFAPSTPASAASLPAPTPSASGLELESRAIEEPITAPVASDPEPITEPRPPAKQPTPERPPPAPLVQPGDPLPPLEKLSSRTLVVVSVVSVLAGIILAVVALKLLG